MPTLIDAPTTVPGAGTPPKTIDEYVGRVNSATDSVSVAHMKSPAGWDEPRQTPRFEEITIVLHGMLRVEHAGGTMDVRSGQALIAHKDEWIRYTSPAEGRRRVHLRVPPGLFSAARGPRRVTGMSAATHPCTGGSS